MGVELGPRHHGMAHPQVADGGDGLQYGGYLRIYWIRSRVQPTMGGLPVWGLSKVLTTSHRTKLRRYEMFIISPDLTVCSLLSVW